MVDYKKTSVFSRILITIFVFLFIYYPPLIQINMLHVLTVFAYVYMLLKRNVLNIIDKSFNHFVAFLFLTIYLILLTILKGTFTEAVPYIEIILEVIPISYFISDLIRTRGTDGHSVWNYLIAAGMIQSIISIAAFMIPSFQNQIINRMISYGFRDVFVKLSEHRVYGFSYTLTYSMPVVQAILAAVCIYKALTYKITYIIFVPFLLMSSIINARIGLIVFVISLFIALLGSAKLTERNFCALIVVIVFIMFIPRIFTYYLGDSKTMEWIQDGIEEINNFLFEHDASSGYFEYALGSEQYKTPEGIGILFGTGLSTLHVNKDYASDVGFINDIWLGGLVYVIPLLLFFSVNTYKMMNFYINKNVNRKLCALLTIILLFIINIKGRCFVLNEIMNLWFLLFVYFVTDKYYNDKETENDC